MKDKERQSRFEMICQLLTPAVELLRRYAMRQRVARSSIVKADGSKATIVEIENDSYAQSHIKERFPGDSVVTEELEPSIVPDARFCFTEDPCDGTHVMIESGIEYNIPTVLQAYADRGEAFAFGVGEVATWKLFTGNVEDGIFLNGAPYTVPEQREQFLLWIDHHEHPDVLREVCGFPEVGQAGVAIRLLLYGYLRGGISVYTHHVYESTCLEAVVRTMGGTIIPFRSPAGQDWQVFSLPGADHAMVVEKARQSVKKTA